MRKTLLGTILAVNVVLLLIALNILYKEASSPISGIKTASDSVKTPEKAAQKTSKKETPPDEKNNSDASKKTDTAAFISINSTPSGAKVFINGYYKAKTPANIKITSISEVPRQYSIKIIQPDFYSWEKMITLTRGGTKEFSVNLKRK
ncbi:PEGA domain-containing protein [bacterium]|nr:PEGA domain-containing protein [bacterium]MBU3956168.1 PEGA domain-containing protein [bacterium]MBU4133931.1 PEGA domain-containing protein [bacterium]